MTYEDAYGFRCICGELVAVPHRDCVELIGEDEYWRYVKRQEQGR